jgi:hypothetical protein
MGLEAGILALKLQHHTGKSCVELLALLFQVLFSTFAL